MRKDSTRDYIIAAFKLYAALGKPDRVKIEQSQLDNAVKQDLIAVHQTMNLLQSSGKDDICNAVEAVYFFNPTKDFKRNEISNRVLAYAHEHFTSDGIVWKWLKEARTICATYRGLNTSDISKIINQN